MKTLLFSLSALVFFVACNSNATTENASIQTPTNTVLTEALPIEKEVYEDIENSSSPQILKYGAHSIWETKNYFLQKSLATKLTRDNINLFKDMEILFMKPIYFYSGRFFIDMEALLYINKHKYTDFGYPFELEETSYTSVAEYIRIDEYNPLSIPSNSVNPNDKFYALFRQNKDNIEFVVNRVRNNKIQEEYVYLAANDFLLSDILAGKYQLDNTDKTVELRKDNTILNFKNFKHYYFKYSDVDKSEMLIICSKCNSSEEESCNYFYPKNSAIYVVKYDANNKIINLYSINNPSACMYENMYSRSGEDLYTLECENIQIGKLAHTLKLKQ